MTNSVSTDVWEMDSAATIYAAGSPVWIRKMVAKFSAADDDINVTDGNDKPIWTVRGIAGCTNWEAYGVETIEFPGDHGMRFDGFKLATIDNAGSGTRLRVYIG